MRHHGQLTRVAASWALAIGMLAASTALADGIPTSDPLRYSGTLYVNDEPYSGPAAVVLSLFSTGQAGATVCTPISRNLNVQNGSFSVALSPECVDAVRTNRDVWLELAVTPQGQALVTLPIQKLSASPYAVEAERAATADEATRVTGAERVLKIVTVRVSRSFQPGWNSLSEAVNAPAALSNCFPIGIELPPNPSANLELHSHATPAGGDPRAQFLRQFNTDLWHTRFSVLSNATGVVAASFDIGIVMSCPN